LKTIEQLLALSKNPYYTFTQEERVVLDDFLLKKSAKDSEKLPRGSLPNSGDDTRVHVRNVIPKTIPHVREAPEGLEAPSEAL